MIDRTIKPKYNLSNSTAAMIREDVNNFGLAPNIRANLPSPQTELPEDGPPSKRTHSTKRHNSRFMPQQCSQGISGSNANYNDADCTHTGPDYFYTAATSQNGTPSSPLTHPNTPNSPNTQVGSHNPRKKRKNLLHIETELQTPTINPLASNCDGGSIWKCR
eukprot:1143910-Pelagomonas_calceolata.AAC.2